ncbi:chemoreceptor glutamine deamidase CheD [Neptunomonas sp.]|uniref:chemoreceptor glutamine deamidase CheD n=1 Tax=Neptunomonas sp. TaxID=1971898 RepID=UPI0025D3BFC5|nr:chemoreceptor glutamine deamidase CheD [Neptunomonas sp.]
MNASDLRSMNESPFPALSGFEHFNRYWLQQRNCFAVKVKPGEYYVTRNNEAITTILGSCVAACIRDPVTGIGGMNHFILPSSMSNKSSDWSDSARYGANAMEMLINTIMKFGGVKERLEIKITGGGRMVQGMSDIGEQNVKFVTQYLIDEGFDIASVDAGGPHPRNVVYLPQQGRLLVKKLATLHNKKLLAVESKLKEQLAAKPVGGDVELF